jgi:hypothetical protein
MLRLDRERLQYAGYHSLDRGARWRTVGTVATARVAPAQDVVVYAASGTDSLASAAGPRDSALRGPSPRSRTERGHDCRPVPTTTAPTGMSTATDVPPFGTSTHCLRPERVDSPIERVSLRLRRIRNGGLDDVDVLFRAV